MRGTKNWKYYIFSMFLFCLQLHISNGNVFRNKISKKTTKKNKNHTKKKKNEKKNDEAWRHTKRCDRPWMRARWRNECSSSSSGGESTQWNSTTNSIITEAPQAAVVTGMVGNRHLVTRFLPLRRSPISHLSLLRPEKRKNWFHWRRWKKTSQEETATRYECPMQFKKKKDFLINYCIWFWFGSSLLELVSGRWQKKLLKKTKTGGEGRRGKRMGGRHVDQLLRDCLRNVLLCSFVLLALAMCCLASGVYIYHY